MSFFNCFLNLNINFSRPDFRINLGCFSMPNWFTMPNFLPQIPILNNFNYFSPMMSFYQYYNPNTPPPSVFVNSVNNFPPPTNFTPYNLNTENFNIPYFEPNIYSNTWPGNFTMPGFDTFSYSNSNSNKKAKLTSKDTKLCNIATSYIGKVNSDREGNRLFSPNGEEQPWCADFVTYVTKKAYGSSLPNDFGSSAVDDLKSWGEKHNCYLAVPNNNKSRFIAQNIKPGDIMIEKRGGKSHTGIVTKVNRDGSFETVEGNTDNAVDKRKYNANSSTLSGFISLDSYA